MGKTLVKGFAPIASDDSKVLILGTMPGVTSLKEHQYYGHAQNTFWRIMADVLEQASEPPKDYADKEAMLLSHHVALWDVMQYCDRGKSSLDAMIKKDSVILNDFVSFLKRHPRIAHIFLNGRMAENYFNKYIKPKLALSKLDERKYQVIGLPSTSPANARMRYEDKKARWEEALCRVL